MGCTADRRVYKMQMELRGPASGIYLRIRRYSEVFLGDPVLDGPVPNRVILLVW